MEEEKVIGVKETLEVLEGIKVLAIAGAGISSDGKVGVDDIKHLVEIAKQFNVLQEGLKDAKLALAELKDLDEVEAVQVIAKVFDIVKSFKEAGEAE